MNVNANSFVISQAPYNIRSNYSTGMKENFAAMLENAMVKGQSIVFLGSDFNNLLTANKDCNVDFEDNDEIQNHISYENLSSLADIFFFRPNVVKGEVAVENETLNVAHAVLDNQLNQFMDHINSLNQGKLMPETKVNTEKPEIEVQGKELSEVYNEKSIFKRDSERPKNEYEHAELLTVDTPPVKNKIITISDESTEIKSQVLTQVKDKIIIMTEKGQDSNNIKTITMELQPQNLGKVNIKMIYENNKLTVEIKALNEETQKILSSNIDELRDMLCKASLDVKIFLKPYEFELKHQPIQNYQNTEQGNEQNFYQSNEQNFGQGRQRNKYYNDNNIKQKKEDAFSELIDLSNLKVKEGRYGN